MGPEPVLCPSLAVAGRSRGPHRAPTPRTRPESFPGRDLLSVCSQVAGLDSAEVGTSRALVAPGVRTAPLAAGWRADVSSTAGTIRAHPRLLLPGVIGFALRGGIILLIVPILILPTSVEVRFLFGSNIGSTGLTGGFYVLVAALSALTMLLALGVLYVLARCELTLFGRFVNHNGSTAAELAWQRPIHLAPMQQRSATLRVFVVQALALLAVLLAAVPLAVGINGATINEVQLPSSADSIYVRVAADVAGSLLVWLVALVVIEAASAVATRRVLARAFSLTAHAHIVRHPLRVAFVAVVGWALFIGALAASVAALSVVWDIVRSVFLSTGLSGELRDIVSALVVALLFGTIFAAALLLCGLVSTFRAGLWTFASLR
jgi:hypothetical protein